MNPSERRFSLIAQTFRIRLWLLLALLGSSASLRGLTLDPQTRVHSANNPADSSGSISVLPKTGEEKWTAKVTPAVAGDDVSWVTALAVPPSFLAYTISENFNAETRRALIIFTSGTTFTLVQSGRGGTLNPASLPFGRVGGSASVEVQVMAGTRWRFENTNAWITFSSPVNNLNSGTRSIAVAANPGLNPRTGTLTIAGQTLTIRQAGEDVILSTNQMTVPYYFNLASISVSAAASMSWRPESNVPWITFSSSDAVQGPGQFSCLISPNDGFNERSGTVTVGSKSLVIRQIANQRPRLQIDPPRSTAAAPGASGAFNVTVSPGTPWKVVSQSAWLRSDSGSIRTNSGAVGITALPNATTQARVGYLTVVRSVPSIPADLDPLMGFPRSMPVLAHLTRADSGVDEVLKTSIWNQVVTLGERKTSYIKESLTWEESFNKGRTEEMERISMLAPDGSASLGSGWISKVRKGIGDYLTVYPYHYGAKQQMPLVDINGKMVPAELPYAAQGNPLNLKPQLADIKAMAGLNPLANVGLAKQPTFSDRLPGYVVWSWSRTNLNQRLVKTKGMNLSNGFSMVVLAESDQEHVFGFDDMEVLVPRSDASGSGAQRLLVASVAVSGLVSIFADGNPVSSAVSMKAPAVLRTSFRPGYQCTIYGSEIGQQTATELADSLNPTRVYEVRQEPFQIEVMPRRIDAAATGGTTEVQVTVAPGVSWIASSPADWVRVDGAATANRLSPGVVNIGVDANNSTEPRFTDLLIADQVVKVTQKGREVNLTGLTVGFTKTDGMLNGTVSPLGGVVTVGIEPENGAQWTIRGETAALNWAKPTVMEGTGTKTVLIAVAPFSSGDSIRTAIFRIGSRAVIITQRNFEAMLSPSVQAVGNEGGIFEGRLDVPASVLWTAVSLTPWIRITTEQQISGAGSFFYQVDAGSGSERFGYVSVGGELFKVVQTSRSVDPTPIVLRLSGLSEDTVDLGLLAPEAETILIEASSDLISWNSIRSATGQGGKMVLLNLPSNGSTKARFFRARR